jgi:hypothetical protein
MYLYPLHNPAGSDTEVQYNDGGIFGADSTFTFNDSTKVLTVSGVNVTDFLLLPLDNDPATPTLAFGDGDTGFYEAVDDVLRLSLGGLDKWAFISDVLSPAGGGAYLRGSAGSTALPTVVPRSADLNTGMWGDTSDTLYLITAATPALTISPTQNVTLAAGLVMSGTSAIGIDMSGGAFATAIQKWPSGVVQTTGDIYFQSTSDSTTAFQFLDADGGTPIVNIDSTNERIGINTATPSAPVHVYGANAEAKVQHTSGHTCSIVAVNGQVALTTRGGATTKMLFATGAGSTIRAMILPNGNVGWGGETDPVTLAEWTSAQPYLTLHNSTHEDADGGRESRLDFRGEQSGGEETILARIQVQHDGSADDQKGEILLHTNDGSDGDSPTLHVKVDAAGNTYLGDGGVTNNLQIEPDGEVVFNGESRIKWTKHAANGVTLTNFTSADAVADLQTDNDGNTYTCTEVAGGNNNLVVDFASVTAFNWVRILAYYNGNPIHSVTVQLEITPFDGSAWDTLDVAQHQGFTTNVMEDHSFFIPDDSKYINSGVVKVRFLHSAATTAGHTFVIDECSLYQ